MGGGNEGGKKACDPSGGQSQNGVMKPFGVKTRAVEVHPGKPIHLGIKKTWTSVEVCAAKMKLPGHRPRLPGKVVSLHIVPFNPAGHVPATVRFFLTWTNVDDSSMLNNDVYWRLCSWNFPSNDHGRVSGELYRISDGFRIPRFTPFIDNYLKIL
jgi:hypothetical protein